MELAENHEQLLTTVWTNLHNELNYTFISDIEIDIDLFLPGGHSSCEQSR